MKTFYFTVRDNYNVDQDAIYVINAEKEELAQEKFMMYICKLPLDFDNFKYFLENNQDISISITDKIVNIE